MNVSMKCNCCAKESVCKYSAEYKIDVEKLKNSIIGRTTEISIRCTEFLPNNQISLKR